VVTNSTSNRRPGLVTLTFDGELDPSSFARFATHRAARLDLALRIELVSEQTATLTVQGQDDLVDAFEAACSLGPSDCLVSVVVRHHHGDRTGRR